MSEPITYLNTILQTPHAVLDVRCLFPHKTFQEDFILVRNTIRDFETLTLFVNIHTRVYIQTLISCDDELQEWFYRQTPSVSKRTRQIKAFGAFLRLPSRMQGRPRTYPSPQLRPSAYVPRNLKSGEVQMPIIGESRSPIVPMPGKVESETKLYVDTMRRLYDLLGREPTQKEIDNAIAKHRADEKNISPNARTPIDK